MRYLICLFVITICSFCEITTAQTTENQFRLDVKPEGVLWEHGPVFLTGRLRYLGTDSITIFPLTSLRLRMNGLKIEGPPNWMPAAPLLAIEMTGAASGPVVLNKGDEISFKINLFDYFTTIPAGSAELKFKLRIWAHDSSEKPIAEIGQAITVGVRTESDKELELRIARLLRSLDTGDRDARVEIYRQGLAIRSPAVMPLLIRGLSDPAARMLLNEMNWTLGHMSEPDNMGSLVDYLAESGAWQHQFIFSLWKGRHIQLTDDQFLKLRSARNPWIRLFLIDLHPSQLEDADIEHLDAEIKQLSQALEDAKKANRSSSQVAQPQSQGGMVPAERPSAPQPPSQ